MKNPPCSVEGKIIQIVYTLKVFVKHEGWFGGEGNCVMIPVNIVQPPHQVNFSMPKVIAPP